MTRYHVDQGELPLPRIERPAPDHPATARKELDEALVAARAAVDEPPWDWRKQGYWRVVGPQMSGWLPDDERAAFLGQFMPELDRLEALFWAEERNS